MSSPTKLDPKRLDHVGDLGLTLSAVLAEKSFRLEDILELRPGVVLEFGRRHDLPLGLYVGTSRVGSGRAIDIGERLGFLVEETSEGFPSPPLGREGGSGLGGGCETS